MSRPRRTRRACLAGLALPLTAALAGCSDGPWSSDESTPGPPSYDHLRETTVHVASGVSLDLPEDVETTDAPESAGLVVLPGTTDVAAATAVDWFADGAAVALLGAEAEQTWRRWSRSEPYRDAFGEGGAESDPEPELIVAFAVGSEYVSTHRSTWGHTDDPSDGSVLEALEKALGDRASRTPRD